MDFDVARRPARFAGFPLDRSRHICAFFDTQEEKYATLVPFIREGLERGEKAFQIVDPAMRDTYVQRLEDGGVDTRAKLASGQLEIVTWEAAYLLDGHFDQRRMAGMLTDTIAASESHYPMIRLTGEMEWALQNRPGVDQLVEYETRLNQTIYRTNHPII